VVSTAPLPFYTREIPGTHCTGGWEGPRVDLDVCEKSLPAGIRSPDRAARSQSLYRLRYPAHITGGGGGGLGGYNLRVRTYFEVCCVGIKGGYTLVTLPRTVTPYLDCVDGTRDHVTYQKLVTR
jgi:hypothetical protein